MSDTEALSFALGITGVDCTTLEKALEAEVHKASLRRKRLAKKWYLLRKGRRTSYEERFGNLARLLRSGTTTNGGLTSVVRQAAAIQEGSTNSTQQNEQRTNMAEAEEKVQSLPAHLEGARARIVHNIGQCKLRHLEIGQCQLSEHSCSLLLYAIGSIPTLRTLSLEVGTENWAPFAPPYHAIDQWHPELDFSDPFRAERSQEFARRGIVPHRFVREARNPSESANAGNFHENGLPLSPNNEEGSGTAHSELRNDPEITKVVEQHPENEEQGIPFDPSFESDFEFKEQYENPTEDRLRFAARQTGRTVLGRALAQMLEMETCRIETLR